MKKLAFLGLLATLLFACTSDLQDEYNYSGHIDDSAPETLTVSFEDNEETRIQLQEGKSVWNKGDLVSVFYFSDANQKWQFQGETGDRVGNLKRVENAAATKELTKVVVVYPYNSEYYINPETCNVKAFLSGNQTYLEDSYGVGENIMISANEYNQFSLRNVCGWLKVQLTGSADKIKSIKLYGNRGEQVAGEIYINSQNATTTLAAEMGEADDEENSTGGNLVFDETILTEVVLDCGDGVSLGEDPISFYIALPPQTFSQGLTIEITDCNNLKMSKSTTNEIAISRNVIQPMKAFEFKPEIPESWKIYYTATHKVEPYSKEVFGVDFVSSEWDQQTGEGVMIFDGEVKYIGRNAFYGLAYDGYVNCLKCITIPEKVEFIYESSFYGCTALTEFRGKFATEDGKGLIVDDTFIAYALGDESSEYVIPNGVKSIGHGAFNRATNLTNVTIPSSVQVIEGHAFQKSGLTSITIPEGTKSIGQYAFDYCDNLSSVTLSSTVGVIHHCAFYGCHKLQTITIPNSVSFIGGDAFYCQGLTEVYCQSVLPPNTNNLSLFYNYDGSGVNIYVYNEALDAYKNKWSKYDNIIKANGDNPFKTATTTITYTTSDGQIITPNNDWTIKSNEYSGGAGKMVIHGNITGIPQYSFRSNSKLTSMTLPESIAVIDETAFYECNNLTNINIPYGVTKIGRAAFEGCSKLSEINLPRGLQCIEESVFNSCGNITITIPSTVESIYRYAFNWTTPTVYFMALVPPNVTYSNGKPDSVFTSVTIYVPSGCRQNYISHTAWSQYKARISEYNLSEYLHNLI